MISARAAPATDRKASASWSTSGTEQRWWRKRGKSASRANHVCLQTTTPMTTECQRMLNRYLVLSAMSLITVAGLVLLSQGSASGSQVVMSSRNYGEALPTYPRLIAALNRGADVTVTISFSECIAAGTGAAGPAVIGGLHINAFLRSQENYVAFSDVHKTLDLQNHPITEYIRYKVTPDDVVSVSTTTLAADSRVLRSPSYRCPMGSGASFTERDG
ncbi:VirK family protein [Pseudonocardia sp. CA-142604]|uniref:VirK family protein n=1 Tax=Pseudonocardia sp. CA-142604 TaxID=3240024 RepID=UPI003D8FF242